MLGVGGWPLMPSSLVSQQAFDFSQMSFYLPAGVSGGQLYVCLLGPLKGRCPGGRNTPQEAVLPSATAAIVRQGLGKELVLCGQDQKQKA